MAVATIYPCLTMDVWLPQVINNDRERCTIERVKTALVNLKVTADRVVNIYSVYGTAIDGIVLSVYHDDDEWRQEKSSVFHSIPYMSYFRQYVPMREAQNKPHLAPIIPKYLAQRWYPLYFQNRSVVIKVHNIGCLKAIQQVDGEVMYLERNKDLFCKKKYRIERFCMLRDTVALSLFPSSVKLIITDYDQITDEEIIQPKKLNNVTWVIPALMIEQLQSEPALSKIAQFAPYIITAYAVSKEVYANSEPFNFSNPQRTPIIPECVRKNSLMDPLIGSFMRSWEHFCSFISGE